MGIVDLTQGIDRKIRGQIPVAKFVPYGAYGEYRGVQCPSCSIRIYPKHKAGELETCVTCGQDFIVPVGAGR